MSDLIHTQTGQRVEEDNWKRLSVCVCDLSGAEMVLVALMAEGDAGMLDEVWKSNRNRTRRQLS